jgi:hypothetical protein
MWKMTLSSSHSNPQTTTCYLYQIVYTKRYDVVPLISGRQIVGTGGIGAFQE